MLPCASPQSRAACRQRARPFPKTTHLQQKTCSGLARHLQCHRHLFGLLGHGAKDLWQHRTQYVANTRWWPPFCLVVDVVVAAIIAIEIVAGVQFHY